jgi:predicted transcriptional regulator
MARDRELPPPLEMMCLNALWEIGEGNVEDVRKVVSQDRPLAYTTVLTLLDRLARRSAVSRRKEGRGFRYQPTVERNKLRRMALKMFLEHHFDGSAVKLRVFLDEYSSASDEASDAAVVVVQPEAQVQEPDTEQHQQSMAATAGAGFTPQE